ncbi:MAG: TatD family hydrolase [Candidatus Staskawiczbacteria bacterium]|jgi:TatD DNase family protein
MKIVDTHSHLNFKAYDADRDEVIKRNLENGVICIDVGTKYETSKRAVELAEKNEGIYAAIGMHPIHIKTDLMKLRMDENEGGFMPLGEEFDKEKYIELAKSPKVVAFGEIGLDYYYKPKSKTKRAQFKELQKNVFIEQLKLAEELNLPVIVHCRMAHADIFEILKTMKLKGVLHGFVGNWDEAKKYLDLGFYIGINGIIFKFNESSEAVQSGQVNIEEVAKKYPLDKILVETDCPYLTPPMAGAERNEPIFVKHVIQKIADLRNITFDEVASATTENAKKLFNI